MSFIKEKYQQNENAYCLLFSIENRLRAFILNKLSNEKKWWQQIKDTNLGNAIKNIQSRDVPFASYIDEHINNIYRNEKDNIILRHEIFYTHLEHLKAIISRYWENIFKHHFTYKNKNDLFAEFEKIKLIRNYVMHNIPIQELEVNKLRGFDSEMSYLTEGIDWEDLFKCYRLYDVKSDIRSEIDAHNEIFKNRVLMNEIPLSTYKLYSNESWWRSNLLNELSELVDPYYNHIVSINNLIIQHKEHIDLVATIYDDLKLDDECKKIIKILNQEGEK